jgi:tRNA N6-adenosine threonylcarbamoyltransferase
VSLCGSDPFNAEATGRNMLVLGIETSCDETGIAVVEDGRRILVNRVLSQVPLHQRFGGVVPEIASRAHVEAITRMIEAALAEAGIPAPPAGRLQGIAVACRPGLVGSLLVGVTAAKCLAWAWGLPLIGVDHLHAHIYASAMTARRSDGGPAGEADLFPAVSMVVSGGHSAIYLSEGWTRHQRIGATTDDAAGEAFDKAAAVLGLGYPGGPLISRAAETGNPRAHEFTRTLFESDSLDFSFSGIKTAILYAAKGQNASRTAPLLAGVRIEDLAASFQEAVVDILVEKLRRALRREGQGRAIIGGGVAANRRLRARLDKLAAEEGYQVYYPEQQLCTDNGAMIAGLGTRLLEEGMRSDLSLDADPVAAR